MLVIVKGDNLSQITKLLGYLPVTYTFGEMFNSFRNSIKKSSKNLATEEIFSLSYDSLLSDLKESVWISIYEEEIPLIKDKILEICY